jgi:hypothetical protein
MARARVKASAKNDLPVHVTSGSRGCFCLIRANECSLTTTFPFDIFPVLLQTRSFNPPCIRNQALSWEAAATRDPRRANLDSHSSRSTASNNSSSNHSLRSRRSQQVMAPAQFTGYPGPGQQPSFQAPPQQPQVTGYPPQGQPPQQQTFQQPPQQQPYPITQPQQTQQLQQSSVAPIRPQQTSSQIAQSFQSTPSASAAPVQGNKKSKAIPNIRLSFITATDQAKFEQLFKSAVGDNKALDGKVSLGHGRGSPTDVFQARRRKTY